jgi:hypothetical protein
MIGMLLLSDGMEHMAIPSPSNSNENAETFSHEVSHPFSIYAPPIPFIYNLIYSSNK